MSDVQIAVVDQQDTQIVLAVPGVQGATGSEIPTGGTADQVLRKSSSTNYDTNWSQVTSAMIADGTIVNADINASAAIAGTKISPDFGSQTVQTTGVISHALGTAGAPTVTFTGDTNTGIYSPGADQVAISTGGTGRLFVDASGNVGLGSTASSTAARLLDVDGGALQPTFQLRASSATSATTAYTLDNVNSLVSFISSDWPIRYFINGSERLRITSAGLVGVGTSSPGSLLDVGSGSAAGVTQLTLKGGATGGDYGIFSIQNGSTSRGRLVADAGVDELRIDTAGGASTKVQFKTGSSYTNALTIDASQRVGIGSTTFSAVSGISGAKLQVLGGTIIGSDGAASNGSGWLAFDSACTAPATTKPLIYHRQGVGLGLLTDSAISFEQGSTERARIDSSGRLLVGTSTARSNLPFAFSNTAARFQVEGAAEGQGAFAVIQNYDSATTSVPAIFNLARSGETSIGSNTIVASGNRLGEVQFSGSDGTNFIQAAVIRGEVDGTPGANDMPGRLVFSTTADGASSPTERMRIGSGGHLYATCNDTSLASLTLRKGAAGADGIDYLQCRDSSNTAQLVIAANGNVTNTNNSYGAFSDLKLKENVVDANSQWDDLKALQVRKYNFKEGQTHTQIGLVAQEVELVSPGLVTESPDRDAEGNDLGTTTKSVNYSVLYMKAVKALQEAMERIETLEAKVAALESA